MAPMKRARRACLNLAITASLALGITAVRAQGLSDAFERAWARYPLASSLEARDAEARARAEVAAGMTPGPAAASLSALSDRLNRNRGAEKWEIEVGVPLWLPGQQAARQAHARSAVADVNAQEAALRLLVARDVRATWWALAAARNARDLALRRVTTARTLESDVLRRFEAGELARTDANLARNERLAAEAEAVDAQTAVLGAEAKYRTLTGIEPPSVLTAENRAPGAASLLNHPERHAAATAADLARAALLVATRSDREAPKLAVRMERDRGDGAEPFSNAIGLKVTIPFSSGAQVRQQTAAALADASRADAALALTDARLAIEVERARAALEAAERQLATAQRRRELTAENLQLIERSFALGESDLTTLLRVRATALEAEALVARQLVASDAARSQLYQALGVLP